VYLSDLGQSNFLTVRGVVTAVEPIAHGEPPVEKKKEGEKSDNLRAVRRVAVCASGSLVRVPVVSSMHVTHLFRTLMVRDLLEKAGVTEEQLAALRTGQPEFYQTLFSGGTLEKNDQKNGEDGGSGKKKAKSDRTGLLKEMFPDPDGFARLFYPAYLFGCSIPWLNAMVEGAVGVGHLWPLVREVADLHGVTAESLRREFGVSFPLQPVVVLEEEVDPMVFSRTDDTASGKRGEGDEDARMIYRVEYIPAGTKFLHELHVEMRGGGRGALLALSALRYLADELLPRHPYLGGMVKRGFGRAEFRYRFPEWEGGPVGKEHYEGYVKERAAEVRAAVERLAGTAA